jgi:hypothetical protein
VSSEPKLDPSSLNWTPETPTLSLAVADIVTELETVDPFVGAERETTGAVVSSTGAKTLKLIGKSVVLTLFDTSLQRTK